MSPVSWILVLALARPPAAAEDERAARWMLFELRHAWEQRDLEGFARLVSPRFQSGERDREGLLEQKRRSFERGGPITVRISDLHIELRGDRATLRFLQEYSSPSLQDRGNKTLVLEKEGGKWLLVGESFEPER